MLKSAALLTILASLADCAVTSTKPNLWAISIDNGPAPPPNKGPPVSANADRDPNHLKWQILAVVISWLGFISITWITITIVGSRLRRKTEAAEQGRELNILKSRAQITMREIEAGPRDGSFKSPGKMASLKSWAKSHKKGQDSEVSVSTVDSRVVEADRARDMDDMTKLYAAVMAQDLNQSNKVLTAVNTPPETQHYSPLTPLSPHFQPNIQSSRPVTAVSSPPPPPPPQYYAQQQYQVEEELPPLPSINDNDTVTLLNSRSPPRRAKPSALSFSNSGQRLGSSHSSRAKPSPILVRGQPISQPLGSADLRESTSAYPQISLSKSAYDPGPPPPTPGKTPGVIVEEYEMDKQARYTGQAEQRQPLQKLTQDRALPFRQFNQDAGLKSAPPTKTTFLDRRTSHLQGPKTGVPQTPYSPYCPSTPMTPITPRRMLTKQEIKANMKANQLKVVRENDIVRNETDTWGYSHEQD